MSEIHTRMRERGATAAQLRADIDSGRTGDKVDWPDPSVAPLLTDDEAAGTSPSALAIQAVRDDECNRVVQPRQSDTAAVLGMVIFVVLLAAALLIWAAVARS
jgi:hypothetical protein